MPSIQPLPPDPQAPPASTPDDGPPSSAQNAGSPGDSPFGNVLASAVNAPAAAVPTAASNAAWSPADKSAPPPQDSAAADPPQVANAADGAQSPQPPAITSTTAKAIPAGSSKTTAAADGSRTNDATSEPNPNPLLVAPPVLLVTTLLQNTSQSADDAAAKAGTPPTTVTDHHGSPPAPSPVANPPPALIAALNSIGNLPVPPSGPQISLKPPAPATTSTTTTAAVQSPTSDEASATIGVQLRAIPAIVPAAVTATATAESVASKTFDPPLPAANKTDSNKTDSEARPITSGLDSRLTGSEVPARPVNISTTSQIAPVLPADANGSQDPQNPQPSGSAAIPGNAGEQPLPPKGSDLAAPNVVNSQSVSPVPPVETTVTNLSFGGTLVGAVSPPPVSNSISATTLDAGKTAPPLTTGESGPSPQPPGAQTPDFSLFATPPASLQLNATTHGAALQSAGNGFNPAQVIEQVAYAIQTTYVSGQEMQLHLNPPDLGSLQVNVSVHDGVLSARLETQNPTTQQILVDNLSQLKDSLSQQGVAFDRIDVRLAGSQTGSNGSGTADPSYGRQPDGGYPWDQSQAFVQPESDDSVGSSAGARGPASRLPLTSLDVMV